MAEPVVRTPDFPDFDTYPASVPASGHLLPRAEQSSAGSLDGAAERVGSAVGNAVTAARRLPEQLNSALRSAKDRLVVVKGKGMREMNSRAADLKQAAGDKARDAKLRARQMANEYPLQVLAGVAAVAFLAGFGLRIWRGSRG
jgi:ElaB/YqjD/DUF883 family membrane-anchored ribosome-binding protein